MKGEPFTQHIGESRSVPVLVERELENPKLAGQYAPGDQIHYKAGSPEKHGVADGSQAAVKRVGQLNRSTLSMGAVSESGGADRSR